MGEIPKSLVIFLHGIGSNGNNLAGVIRHFSSLLPDVAFASPNAPMPFEYNIGYQWFSVNGITLENRYSRVCDARVEFDAILKRLLLKHSIFDSWERVVLVGFSQGSIMALDVLASGRYPLAGVVAFSGCLLFDAILTPKPFSSAFLIHGYADSIISWRETKSAAERLKIAGVSTTTLFEETNGHSISPKGIKQAASFIEKCFQ